MQLLLKQYSSEVPERAFIHSVYYIYYDRIVSFDYTVGDGAILEVKPLM